MKNRCNYITVLTLFLISVFSMSAQELIGSRIVVEDDNFAIGQDVSLSADGKRLVTSGYGESTYGVKVYDLVDGNWEAQAAIAETEFPSEMVVYTTAISADGNTVAVGAVRNSFENNSGRVRLYRPFNEQWIQVGETIMPNTEDEFFGQKLALSADGNRILIGAKYNSEIEKNQGRVVAFEYNGTNWEQLGQSIYGERKGFKFGSSVSFSENGNVMNVGSIGGYKTNGVGNLVLSAGFMSVYRFENGEWASVMKRSGEYGDYLGIGTAVSGDGSTVVVGATQNFDDPGYLKIYKYNDFNALFLFQEIEGFTQGSKFGRSISISEDGLRIAIASVPANGLNEASSISIYQLKDDSYRQLGKFSVGEPFENLGTSLDLSADGSTVAVGALTYDFYNRGAEMGYVVAYDLTDLQFSEPPPPPPPGGGPNLGEVQLYPNPASNILFCDACSAVAAIAIYDVSGKKILSIAKYKSEEINVTSLQSGLYYVYLTNTAGEVEVKKIVKN